MIENTEPDMDMFPTMEFNKQARGGLSPLSLHGSRGVLVATNEANIEMLKLPRTPLPRNLEATPKPPSDLNQRRSRPRTQGRK